MSDHKDDQALEEYLKSASDLSRQYQAEKQAEPPAHLDAAIIQAARSAVTKKTAPRSRNWYVPLSLAAVVVIGVSVVFRMYEYKGQNLLTEPASDQLLDKKSDRDVIGESVRTKPAEPPATAASAPQTYQQKMEKDDLQGELMRKEINEAPAESRATGQSPAGAELNIEYELAQPEAQKSPMVAPEADMLLKKETSNINKQAATAAAESRVLSETEWLKNISQLWEAGKKDEAVASLKQFLITYPQYSHEEIIKQLPADFDPSQYISGFEIN